LEIAANLRQLLESHDPLIISFHERSQRFQSYVVHIDRDNGVLALDEMIPAMARSTSKTANRSASKASMTAYASPGSATHR
jgi:c-di-GMP-binding flagellar brake protein YcgR